MRKYGMLILAVAVLGWTAMAQTGASSQTQGSTQSGASTTTTQPASNAAGSAGASASQDVNATQNPQTPAQSTEGKGSTTGAVSENAGAAAANAGQNGGAIASGTAIQAKLSKTLDSKKVKVGDAVEAKTTADVKSGDQVVLRKGSKLLGKVTQASARSKGDAQSTLTLVFDRAVPKGGGAEIPLNLTIRALAAPERGPAMDNDMGAAGTTSASGPSGPPSGPAGGLGSTVGGVGNTAGGAVGGAASTVGSTAGAVGSAAGSTANAGLSATGTLETNAQGALGLPGVTLNQSTSASQGATIQSSEKSVHLESGTQLVLVVGGGSNQ